MFISRWSRFSLISTAYRISCFREILYYNNFRKSPTLELQVSSNTLRIVLHLLDLSRLDIWELDTVKQQSWFRISWPIFHVKTTYIFHKVWAFFWEFCAKQSVCGQLLVSFINLWKEKTKYTISLSQFSLLLQNIFLDQVTFLS